MNYMINAGGQRIHIMKMFTINTTIKSKVTIQILGAYKQLIRNMLKLQQRNNRRLQRMHKEKPYNLYNNKQTNNQTNTSKLQTK
jgi:cysteine synthase